MSQGFVWGNVGYIIRALSGFPNAQRGQKKSTMVPSSLLSRVPMCVLNGNITLALSGVPNDPHKDNIKDGFINHAVSRANMRTTLLHQPSCLESGNAE